MLFIGSGRKELLEQKYPDLRFVFHEVPFDTYKWGAVHFDKWLVFILLSICLTVPPPVSLRYLDGKQPNRSVIKLYVHT